MHQHLTAHSSSLLSH